MDQLAVHFGEKDKLLPIVCQPSSIFEAVAIPHPISFCGIDSGVRHAVGGASYGDVRTAAFMGYTIIALAEGASPDDLKKAKGEGDWSRLPYGGYLANVPADLFAQRYEALLPDACSGNEFINRYGVSIDGATEVSPDKTYRLRVCARHPVYENHRVKLFKQWLSECAAGNDVETALQRMGVAMIESHRSYTAVGLGNSATDDIVEDVLQAGASSGVYGARISGGGNGGTVTVLCVGERGKETAQTIFTQHKERCGRAIHFFIGSSDGAFWLNKAAGVKSNTP